MAAVAGAERSGAQLLVALRAEVVQPREEAVADAEDAAVAVAEEDEDAAEVVVQAAEGREAPVAQAEQQE